MADWRDVMTARTEADQALDAMEGGTKSQPDLVEALLTGARAVCLELRALGVTLDYGLDAAPRPH